MIILKIIIGMSFLAFAAVTGAVIIAKDGLKQIKLLILVKFAETKIWAKHTYSAKKSFAPFHTRLNHTVSRRKSGKRESFEDAQMRASLFSQRSTTYG